MVKHRTNDITSAFAAYKSPKLDALKSGDTLMADAGFTCIKPGAVLSVQADEGGLYVKCRDGRHYLDGQLAEDDGTLVGLVRLPKVSA